MKVYTIVEAQYISNDCCRRSEDLSAYATVYPTRAAALANIRNVARSVVEASYEGLDEDEMPDIESILDEIFASTSETQWWWDADDRSVTWRIIEADLKTKPKKGAHK